jgi:hypothetical protein
MLYSSGMNFGGVVASSLSAMIGHAPESEIRLLSDRLPAAVLYVTVSTPSLAVTPAIDRALRAAHRDSSRFLGRI